MSEKDADGGLLHHLEMSYDFFKKVAEATTNDLELDEAPSAEAGALRDGSQVCQLASRAELARRVHETETETSSRA